VQCTRPRERVVVVAVDERAVDVDEHTHTVHRVRVPVRMAPEPPG
jgi:hypothetical protein